MNQNPYLPPGVTEKMLDDQCADDKESDDDHES